MEAGRWVCATFWFFFTPEQRYIVFEMASRLGDGQVANIPDRVYKPGLTLMSITWSRPNWFNFRFEWDSHVSVTAKDFKRYTWFNGYKRKSDPSLYDLHNYH